MKQNGLDNLIIGMEPTGHYWFNLGEYCRDNTMKIVLVNPFHVKRCKELDDNSPTKNDRKDPKTIAKLVIDGRYVETYMPTGIYAELRRAFRMYDHVTGCKSVVVNKILQWLDNYFPEFTEVFGSWDCKSGMITLREFPRPLMIVDFGETKVLEIWKKEIKQGVGKKRAQNFLHKGIDPVYEHIWHPPHADRTKEFRALTQRHRRLSSMSKVWASVAK